MTKCLNCGTEFTPSPTHPLQQFCGRSCRRAHKSRTTVAVPEHNKVQRSCVACGTVFTVSALHPTQQYCSPLCRQRAYIVRRRATQVKVEVIAYCEHCGGEMVVSPKANRKRFCSTTCRSRHNNARVIAGKWNAIDQSLDEPIRLGRNEKMQAIDDWPLECIDRGDRRIYDPVRHGYYMVHVMEVR